MNCNFPVRIWKNLDRSIYPDGLEVPCGNCLACRIQKRTEWTTRLVHESEFWDSAVFITLTYSDEFLPFNGRYATLKKTDLQKFLKRVRKRITPNKVKYFACGEYGDLNKRPHYHLILFGLGLTPEDKNIIKDCWKFCEWDMLDPQKCFGTVTEKSMRYVAQYIDKKFTGELEQEEYHEKGIEPVFKICSLGIGERFAEKYKDKIEKNGYVSINGSKRSIPRYYVKKFDIDITLPQERAKEKEIDMVSDIIGLNYCRDDIYKIGIVDDVIKLEDTIREKNCQREKNLQAYVDLKDRTI